MYGNQYPSGVAELAPQDGQLSLIEQKLAQLRERLAQSTGELGSITDRCFGTRPQPAPDKTSGNLAGSGLISRLEAEAVALELEIAAIEERVKRLCAL